jgi:hypothetical protein
MLEEAEGRLEPRALLSYVYTQLDALSRLPRRAAQVVDRLEGGTVKVGIVPTDLGDLERLLRSAANRVGAADHYLSDCAMRRRDYTLAEQHRLSALENALTSGDVARQAMEILGLAMTAPGLGRDEDALRLEGAADAKWHELGVSNAVPFIEAWRERDLGAARARLGEPRVSTAFDEGRAMTWDQAIELALGKSRPT